MLQAKLPSRQNSMRASSTGLASSAGSIESAGANTGNSSLKSRGGTPFEALNKDTTGGTLEAWLLIEYCDRGSLQASNPPKDLQTSKLARSREFGQNPTLQALQRIRSKMQEACIEIDCMILIRAP